MNQIDEELLPAPIIEDGLTHSFDVMEDGLWEDATGEATYAKYFRDMGR